ncbi:LPXTG cell wall anchor domain-containing protein [Listeria rocourtiae]|uniref:LPXTG cell wall anchor domain-containing protein n=1 Tax=Listeria rocourtiae TaxID=647910 RepID=UPI0016284AC7|nr:LPXTG cell wall anchor domain-containing protein [Listeria rocourtiae]MBC1435348.1 LPXTG cell wall anchor domain-containing protein [Listeria rocourtiae]
MSKTTKLACGLLACGLTFSLAAPVFAEEETQAPVTETVAPETNDTTETTTTEDSTPKAQLKTVAAVQKENVSFVKDTTPVVTDFIAVSDASTTLAYKAGTEPKTTVAGTFSTTIVATLADATTQEFIVSYTVTEPVKATAKVAALATAKTNVTTEINEAVKDPSKFVTATAGVTLSFVKAPVVNRLGAQTVTVTATDGTTTENITASYTVVDTTKPEIEVYEDNFYVGLDEDWYVEELVDATDNSGFVKTYFANGKETLDTSKEGTFAVEVIAEDASGNTSSVTLTYTVVGEDFYFFDAPVVNVAKTTATDIYGTAEPLTTVLILTEDGDLFGMADADENGNFHIELEEALVNGQTVFLVSMDMDTGEFSDVAEFTFQGGTLKVDPVDTTKKPSITQVVKKAPVPVKTTPVAAPAKATTLKELPKTGDNSSAGLVFAGFLVSGLAVALLRKRG